MSHPPCAAEGCQRPRTRGKLCYRCNRELAHEIHPCRHPDCTNQVWRDDYCGNHDHGIDWAAADWYDDVAVERVWLDRRDTNRLPTEPEVRELIARADREDVSYNELARRLGIDGKKFESWRRTLNTIDQEAAA